MSALQSSVAALNYCVSNKSIDDHKMLEAFWSFLDIWIIAFSIQWWCNFIVANKFTNSSQLENLKYQRDSFKLKALSLSRNNKPKQLLP